MLDFLDRHALLMGVLGSIFWPTITGIVTALFKPKTPEQYAAMPKRLAAFLKFVGAIGFDVPNTLEAVRQGIANKSTSVGVYRATRSSPLPAPVPDDIPTRPILPAQPTIHTGDTPVPSTRPEKP